MLPLDDHVFPMPGNFEPWFYWKCSLCPCLIFPPTRSLPRSASLASHQRLCVFSLHFLIVSFFSCLFQLSCLQVLMLCLSLSLSNLCAKVFFFITRISIWLFYISLYWIHHSFSCVVFNISLSSLLLSPFKSLKTLCLFGFWNILLILPFHSLSGTLSTLTLWNHHFGVVGFWFS